MKVRKIRKSRKDKIIHRILCTRVSRQNWKPLYNKRWRDTPKETKKGRIGKRKKAEENNF